MREYDKNLTFEFANIRKTDIELVSVYDKRTGFWVRTVIPNAGKQTASLAAFAGARYSRSADSVEEIFHEIKKAGGNAQEKLANIFRNYGHASVADMAQVFVYIENIPQVYAAKFFNETSIGGGQERSTRYQDFSNLPIYGLKTYLDFEEDFDEPDSVQEIAKYEDLNQKFVDLQKDSLRKYQKYVGVLTDEYSKIYDIDENDKGQKGALTARVFDSARYFLLGGLGNRTSLAWITSAREWSRLISFFKSRPENKLRFLAEQLEVLLAPDPEFAKKVDYVPEAPDLIRHTSADESTSNCLEKLAEYLSNLDVKMDVKFKEKRSFVKTDAKLYTEKFSAGEKVVAQNILTLYPNIDEDWLLDWIKKLPEKNKKELGEIVINDFDHHQQMGNQFRVNTHSFVLDCTLAEARDLNRHRAWGRFLPFLSTQNYVDLLPGEYSLPAYLYENKELAEIRKEFEADLVEYYKNLDEFVKLAKVTDWFPQELIIELLPFAHITKMWMHGSPKEISYLTKLRVRPGGHINYRILAHQMAEKASKSDVLLSGLELEQEPDPTSSKEFFDRS